MRRLIAVALAAAVTAVGGASSALASHSWGNYHWARTANPFTVPLGDNVTNTAYSNWEGALGEASSDWTQSSVLDSPVAAGNAGSPKRCRATDGRIEVCKCDVRLQRLARTGADLDVRKPHRQSRRQDERLVLQ